MIVFIKLPSYTARFREDFMNDSYCRDPSVQPSGLVRDGMGPHHGVKRWRTSGSASYDDPVNKAVKV